MNVVGARARTRQPCVAGLLAAATVAWMANASAVASAADLPGARPLVVVADGVPGPLTASAGDAQRGRALLIAREAANCVLCHAVPDPAMRFSGNVGPALAGVGGRFSAAQLRLRVADNLQLNPASVMPSYYRVSGLDRVAAPFAGQPILTAGQVEDVIAYLGTLQ